MWWAPSSRPPARAAVEDDAVDLDHLVQGIVLAAGAAGSAATTLSLLSCTPVAVYRGTFDQLAPAVSEARCCIAATFAAAVPA